MKEENDKRKAVREEFLTGCLSFSAYRSARIKFPVLYSVVAR